METQNKSNKETRKILEAKLAKLNKALGIIEQSEQLLQLLESLKPKQTIKLLLENNSREEKCDLKNGILKIRPK